VPAIRSNVSTRFPLKGSVLPVTEFVSVSTNESWTTTRVGVPRES
jgi:hypothetical protein